MVKSLETGWGQGILHVLHGWVDGLMDGQIDTAQNIPTTGFKKIHNSKKQPPSNNKYRITASAIFCALNWRIAIPKPWK